MDAADLGTMVLRTYILVGDKSVRPTQKEMYYLKNIFTSANIDIQYNL